MKERIPGRTLSLVLTLVLITGCGARTAPTAQGITARQARTEPASARHAPTVGTSSPSPSPAPTPGTQPAQGHTPPPGVPSPAAGSGLVRISLDHLCAEPGQQVAVTLHGPARAGFVVSTFFEGWNVEGPSSMGTTDDDGMHHWRFVVPVGVPDGTGTVTTAMTGADWGTQGGTARANFRVASPGRC